MIIEQFVGVAVIGLLIAGAMLSLYTGIAMQVRYKVQSSYMERLRLQDRLWYYVGRHGR